MATVTWNWCTSAELRAVEAFWTWEALASRLNVCVPVYRALSLSMPDVLVAEEADLTELDFDIVAV